MAKNDTKQELALVLYMSGLSQEEILFRKVGSEPSDAQPLDKHPGWKEMKAARNNTRPNW